MTGALTPQEAPGAPKQHGRGSFKWLDKFLSEDLRRGSPTLVGRCRVLAGSACILSLLNVAFLVFLMVIPHPLRFVVVGVFTTAGSLGSLVLLRRGPSPWPPVVLLVSSLLAPPVFLSFFQADPYISTHAMVMLIPAVAVYLLGPRTGLIIALSISLLVGVADPVYRTQLGSGPQLYYEGQYWMLHILAGISIMVGWWLSWLYSTSRDRAQSALEDALKTIRTSESRLASLIESTEDIVCSIDTQGRLLTANSALKLLFLRRFGKEPMPGQEFLGLVPPEQQERWRQRFARALTGERLRFEEQSVLQDVPVTLDISLNPIFEEGRQVTGLTLFVQDITARKQAEARLSEMHRTLLDVSRQAGMAEIATGVLHNVGNTLNSVNISVGLVTDGLRKFRVDKLDKAVCLLREHSADLGTFLTTDPQGRKLPDYLTLLSGQMAQDRAALLVESKTLAQGIEHIKSVVSMQQEHARASWMEEWLSLPQLIDEALHLHLGTFERLGIQVQREYTEVPPLLVDRHRLLQILLNLLSNARDALLDVDRPDKRITLRVGPGAEARLRIEVADNGVGIAPESLPLLFTQGFTTKQSGHGFGLHSSALAAAEMRGRLTFTSAGPGQGSTFTLELPIQGKEAAG